MTAPTPDQDDTARLLLMIDPTVKGPLSMHQAMALHCPEAPGHVSSHLWTKHKGLDGRIRATHDIESGERL